MRFELKKNRVALAPETPEERVLLTAVWRTLIDCNGFARQLTPIGEYVPAKGNQAQFVIEGDGADELPDFPKVVVDFPCQVYCDICNRMQELQPGQAIPPCCGKLMAFID